MFKYLILAITAASTLFFTLLSNAEVEQKRSPVVVQQFFQDQGKVLNKNIVVAIIDTGIDLNHKNFKGLKISGWNFVDNNSDLTDNVGHGTHIAGLIRSGASGTSFSLMVLKYYDPKSESKADAFESSLKALKYAINNGADIINYSGGGEGSSSEELELLKEAESKGILVVSAAGNDSRNIDDKPYFPASYRLSNIISVASSSSDGNSLSEESNYGSSTVDVAAPGNEVYSSLPGNKYGYLSGTSQSTAIVTGAITFIKANHPTFSYKEAKNLLLTSVTKRQNLFGRVSTSGVLAINAQIAHFAADAGQLVALRK